MTTENVIRQKVSIKFAKEGLARFFSHHDLMRLFERALRRAEVPVRLTQGFNPQPRMVFPAPLSLGISSDCELLELELAEKFPLPELSERLGSLMPCGLRLLSAEALPPVRRGLVAQRSVYAFSGFPADEESARRLQEACAGLLGQTAVAVERVRKDGRKTVDIRPSILRLEVRGPEVELEVDHASPSTARPDEVAGALCRPLGFDPKRLAVRRARLECA